MRKTIVAVVLLGLALVLQLTVVNGLRLPGGAVPDLVLVLVGALAMTGGPVRGMVTGFVAGLCLDLAPPGSPVLGEYALVLCLVGWAAGRLGGILGRSALASAVALGGVVSVGEAVVAGLSRALDPAQVDVTDIRHVLPYSVTYDLIAVPFALVLAWLGAAWAGRMADDSDRVAALAGTGGSASGLVRVVGEAGYTGYGGRTTGRHRARQPNIAAGLARRDGWAGSHPGGLSRAAPRRRPASPRFRAAGGASVPVPRRPASPRFRAAGGASVPVPRRRPASPRFRAAGGASVPVPRRRPASPRFRAAGSPLTTRGPRPAGADALRIRSRQQAVPRLASRHGRRDRAFASPAGAGLGGHRLPRQGAAREAAWTKQPAWRRPMRVSFRARRGDVGVGRLPGSAVVTPSSRKKAVPRFRGTSPAVPSALARAVAAGRVGDPQAALAARRRYVAVPRLRPLARRRGDTVARGSFPARVSSRPGRAWLRGGGAQPGRSPAARAAYGGAPGAVSKTGLVPLASPRFTATASPRSASAQWRKKTLPLSASAQLRRKTVPRRASLRLRARGLTGRTQGAASRSPRQPQLRYGRQSALSRFGGRLAGRRSAAWLLGKRTGGVR